VGLHPHTVSTPIHYQPECEAAADIGCHQIFGVCGGSFLYSSSGHLGLKKNRKAIFNDRCPASATSRWGLVRGLQEIAVQSGVHFLDAILGLRALRELDPHHVGGTVKRRCGQWLPREPLAVETQLKKVPFECDVGNI